MSGRLESWLKRSPSTRTHYLGQRMIKPSPKVALLTLAPKRALAFLKNTPSTSQTYLTSYLPGPQRYLKKLPKSCKKRPKGHHVTCFWGAGSTEKEHNNSLWRERSEKVQLARGSSRCSLLHHPFKATMPLFPVSLLQLAGSNCPRQPQIMPVRI